MSWVRLFDWVWVRLFNSLSMERYGALRCARERLGARQGSHYRQFLAFVAHREPPIVNTTKMRPPPFTEVLRRSVHWRATTFGASLLACSERRKKIFEEPFLPFR